MMFDSNHIPQDLMTNGAYYAFQKLGEYYHVGNFFVVVYALTNLIGQFSVMVLSVDAPLRMLLDSADSRFIPGKMFEKNEHGTYVNGHRLVTLIVCVLIVVPAFGIRNVDALVRWLVKVNSVCMPLRYLWVFVAYIALKRAGDAFCGEYRFVKGKTAGILVGGWCFLFTAFCMSDRYLLRRPLPAGSEYRDSLCAGRTWVHYAMDGSKGEKSKLPALPWRCLYGTVEEK